MGVSWINELSFGVTALKNKSSLTTGVSFQGKRVSKSSGGGFLLAGLAHINDRRSKAKWGTSGATELSLCVIGKGDTWCTSSSFRAVTYLLHISLISQLPCIMFSPTHRSQITFTRTPHPFNLPLIGSITCHPPFLPCIAPGRPTHPSRAHLGQGSHVFDCEALHAFARSLTVLVLCHVFSTGLSPSHKYHSI